MPQTKLSIEIIKAAIEGFESQKSRIDSQIADLRRMLDGAHTEATGEAAGATRKRKKFSAAARRHMKEAQQRRWARLKGESEPLPTAVSPPVQKPKRKLSAAGRRAISVATKKRWALKRAEAEKRQPRTTKKTYVTKTLAKRAAA